MVVQYIPVGYSMLPRRHVARRMSSYWFKNDRDIVQAVGGRDERFHCRDDRRTLTSRLFLGKLESSRYAVLGKRVSPTSPCLACFVFETRLPPNP